MNAFWERFRSWVIHPSSVFDADFTSSDDESIDLDDDVSSFDQVIDTDSVHVIQDEFVPEEKSSREPLLPYHADASEARHIEASSSELSSWSWKTLLKFLGPGYLVAVGYMDPGNWATDIEAGAKYGYRLLFVVLLASLLGALFQLLCIKLTTITRYDLAQQCRRTLPPTLNLILYILAEVAIVATDLAEVIGCAIALKLLFGIPPLWGVLITSLDVLIILKWWDRRYQRVYEAAILVLVLLVAGCFIAQVVYTRPSWLDILQGFVPTSQIVTNSDMLILAVGILGATVMPHNLYLHANLCRSRRIHSRKLLRLSKEGPTLAIPSHSRCTTFGENEVDVVPVDGLAATSPPSRASFYTADEMTTQPPGRLSSDILGSLPRVPSTRFDAGAELYARLRRAISYFTIDTVIALLFAFMVNATILIVGGSAFHLGPGETIDDIQKAYFALLKNVGSVAASLFAIALLASGQSSTVTGTLAGQIVMSGFLNLRLRPLVRRLVTRLLAIVPAFITIWIEGDEKLNQLIVYTQVVLGIQLPFAVLPLVYFTSSKKVMGNGKFGYLGSRFVNGWPLTLISFLAAVLVVILNIYTVVGIFQSLVKE